MLSSEEPPNSIAAVVALMAIIGIAVGHCLSKQRQPRINEGRASNPLCGFGREVLDRGSRGPPLSDPAGDARREANLLDLDGPVTGESYAKRGVFRSPRRVTCPSYDGPSGDGDGD